MTLPLWVYPLLALALLSLIAWRDERQNKRKLDNFRAVEAERRARENAYPSGNVDRWAA